MAKNMLPVDFRDDILSENMNNRRRYQMINNSDGTVSLVDVTEYEQVGSVFGQAQINAICAAVNGLTDSVSDAFSEEKTYAVGDYAIYENTLYRFTAEKTAGVWNPTVAEAVTVAGELDKLNGNMPKIFNGYVNFKITDREQPISVTFPQAFSEIPSVIGMVKRSGYANQTFWTLTAVSKTSATFYVTTGGNTANNADCTLYWIAVGR